MRKIAWILLLAMLLGVCAQAETRSFTLEVGDIGEFAVSVDEWYADYDKDIIAVNVDGTFEALAVGKTTLTISKFINDVKTVEHEYKIEVVETQSKKKKEITKMFMSPDLRLRLRGDSITLPPQGFALETLVMRDGAGKQIGYIYRGEICTITGENSEQRFEVIKNDGLEGTVSNVSLVPYEENSVYGSVLCRALNVRTGPGTSYAKIGLLYRNARVKILGEENSYFLIVYGTSVGYASKHYIKTEQK